MPRGVWAHWFGALMCSLGAAEFSNFTIGPYGGGGTLQISWMPLQELAGACPRSFWAVPRGVWAYWFGALMCSLGDAEFPNFTIGPYGSGGYITDLLDALTGASWGLPMEFLISALGCVGTLIRGPDVLPGSCRVP